MFDFIKNIFPNGKTKSRDEISLIERDQEEEKSRYELIIEKLNADHALELKNKESEHKTQIDELNKSWQDYVTNSQSDGINSLKKPSQTSQSQPTNKKILKERAKDFRRTLEVNDKIVHFTLEMIKTKKEKPLPTQPPYFNKVTNSFVNWETNKIFNYIIIDTSVFFQPTGYKELKKLLNRIKSNNNKLKPIITQELQKEYLDITQGFRAKRLSNSSNDWLETFPVIEFFEYIENCHFEPTNTNYTNQHQLHMNSFKTQLTRIQKDELDKSDGGDWDRIHAAKALALNALFISEDSGLLQLNSDNNNSINLKCYPLLDKQKRGNIKNYNRPINEFLINNKII